MFEHIDTKHTVDRSYYTCMANWTVSYKVGRARRTARWIVHTTHQLYLGGGSDLASCSLLPLENKHPMTDRTTYASPLYFITCGLRTLPCVPTVRSTGCRRVLAVSCMHVAKTKVLSDAPPFRLSH